MAPFVKDLTNPARDQGEGGCGEVKVTAMGPARSSSSHTSLNRRPPPTGASQPEGGTARSMG
jgi:hypothetical protein